MQSEWGLAVPLARYVDAAAAARACGFPREVYGLCGPGAAPDLVVYEGESLAAGAPELAALEAALHEAAAAPAPIPTRVESATVIPSPGVALDLGAGDQRYDTLYCLTVNQASDARLKRDVADLPAALGMPLARALRPVTFRYVGGARAHLGFVAQEVRAALAAAAPGADYAVWCSTPVADPAAAGLPAGLGEVESLRPDQLIAVLAAAVRELDASRAAQAAELAALRARLDAAGL